MINQMWDTLWLNTTLATMAPGDVPYGLIKQAAIAVKGDKIVWVGARADLPDAPERLAKVVQDVEGRCITPGPDRLSHASGLCR